MNLHLKWELTPRRAETSQLETHQHMSHWANQNTIRLVPLLQKALQTTDNQVPSQTYTQVGIYGCVFVFVQISRTTVSGLFRFSQRIPTYNLNVLCKSPSHLKRGTHPSVSHACVLPRLLNNECVSNKTYTYGILSLTYLLYHKNQHNHLFQG